MRRVGRLFVSMARVNTGKTGKRRSRAGKATGTRSRKQALNADALSVSSRLAERMPFVHFPARARLEEWSTWGALRPSGQLGKTADAGPFGQLRNEHVFAYAGPCCFAEPEDIGDVAAYLDPTLDQRVEGSASPFDSGALEGDGARLQDWAQKSESVRWQFLQDNSVSLSGWRSKFKEWLLHCYKDPNRYLDTAEDRYSAGLPERTRPPRILVHNGPRGTERYGSARCADRRAWTWEARFSKEIPFQEIRVLHLPLHRLQAAAEASRDERFGTGGAPTLIALPPGADSSPDMLYIHSRDAIEVFL